ncbi:MAG: hypothetical protein IPL01_10825 [Acidobacteria bacterium]|nr:hypothetical protein [Acidobacteriota bacterium]
MNALGSGYNYSYYRAGGGAEVDLVLEGDFGLVAVEIKHTSVVNTRDLLGLRNFVNEEKARFGLVINSDTMPRIYEENLVGIPVNWL